MSETTHTCPLCPFTDDTRDDVYDHLLSGHRKGAISAVLLDRQTNEPSLR